MQIATHRALVPLALIALFCLPAGSQMSGWSGPISGQIQVDGQVDSLQDNSPPPTYTMDHLDGVVVSSVDGKPVARVLVTSPDRRMAVMTDYQGRFSFDFRRVDSSSASASGLSSFPPTGAGVLVMVPVQFSLRKPGYVGTTTMVRLPALKPDTPDPPIQLKITPAAILTGHVDPESGEMPANLFVQLRRKQVQDGIAVWVQNGGTQTDSRGEFRFANLQPGDYKLMTNAWTPPEAMRVQKADSVQGFLPAFYPDTSNIDAAATIHISPGETVAASLVLRRATFYKVSLPIADADASKGVGVNLVPDSEGLNIGFNGQSHAVEGYLPTGAYLLRTMTGAPMQTSTTAHLHVNNAPVTGPAITPGAAADLPVIVHREFTAASTNQLEQFGSPVSVNLVPLNGGGFANTNTSRKPGGGDEGLKLTNVSEGVYRVQIYANQGYAATVTSGPTDLLREPLTVGPGGTAAPIEITLRDDYATVTGQVVTGAATEAQTTQANPIFIMGISLDRPEAEPSQSVAMGQGTSLPESVSLGLGLSMQPNQFMMPNLAPGRYLLLASRDQLFQTVEYRNPDVLKDLLSKGTVITVSSGQKASIQIPLMAGIPEEAN
jgi:hypothetical protein